MESSITPCGKLKWPFNNKANKVLHFYTVCTWCILYAPYCTCTENTQLLKYLFTADVEAFIRILTIFFKVEQIFFKVERLSALSLAVHLK